MAGLNLMQILSEAQGEGKRGGDLKKKIVLDQIETVTKKAQKILEICL